MSRNALANPTGLMPFLDDFFKPWNAWFDNDAKMPMLKVPAVNIVEKEEEYEVSLAAPGLKKSDFHIDVEGNMLTISAQKEEEKSAAEKRFTKREYSYTSFSRSFTLPDEVVKDKINAKYEDGVLTLTLPCNEGARKPAVKQIAVN